MSNNKLKEYRLFFQQQFNKVEGTPKDRMKQISSMWKQSKENKKEEIIKN
jgi:hypothetical protein